jgi:hypothetical protein
MSKQRKNSKKNNLMDIEHDIEHHYDRKDLEDLEEAYQEFTTKVSEKALNQS